MEKTSNINGITVNGTTVQFIGFDEVKDFITFRKLPNGTYLIPDKPPIEVFDYKVCIPEDKTICNDEWLVNFLIENQLANKGYLYHGNAYYCLS